MYLCVHLFSIVRIIRLPWLLFMNEPSMAPLIWKRFLCPLDIDVQKVMNTRTQIIWWVLSTTNYLLNKWDPSAVFSPFEGKEYKKKSAWFHFFRNVILKSCIGEIQYWESTTQQDVKDSCSCCRPFTVYTSWSFHKKNTYCYQTYSLA